MCHECAAETNVRAIFDVMGKVMIVGSYILSVPLFHSMLVPAVLDAPCMCKD